MTRSRIALFSLGLAVLSILGAGIYLYQNLPELLRLQAERTLKRYGVDAIEYEGLRFSHANASVDVLKLRGSHKNLAYQASVTSGTLHYNWRTLLTGGVQSMSLSSLELSLAHTAPRDNRNTATTINVEEFLPPQLLAQLPFQSLRIDTWRASYRSPGDRIIAAHGSLIIDEQIDLRLQTDFATCTVAALLTAEVSSPKLLLQLSMTDDQVGVATLEARLARGAGLGWEWQLQGQTQHASLLTCLREFDNQQGLALDIPASADLLLTGDSVFTARIKHPDTLNLAAAPDADDAPLRQVQASLHLTNTIVRLDIPTLIDHVNGTLTLDATLANARVNTVLQPFQLAGNLATQRLSLPEHWLRRMGWGETIPIHLETAEPVTLASGDNKDWTMQSPNSLVSLGDKNTLLRVEKLNLDVATNGYDPRHASVQLDALLTSRLDKQALPQLQLAFILSGTLEQSEFALHIADATMGFRADLTGALNPAQGSGDYTLTAHVDDLPYFTATGAPLLKHFDVLEHSVAMRSGKITLSTTLTSTGFALDNWSQRSQLSATDVSGNFNDYAFDNLDLTADWSGITRWKTLHPLQISVATFNPGIAMQDIQLLVSLPKGTPIAQPQVRIDAFSAKVFGGELALPDAPLWDFAAVSNSATFTANGWQLGELVALQKKADIEAVGTLEGALPITIADGRVSIDSGYLRALPPGGHIRYRANENTLALAGKNSELALALRLLSDFQYQQLSSEVQLDKAGNLLLALSLAGSNPALYDGQSIRFNINVEQNLDPLLQSLRIGDNLEQRIEGGLRAD